MIFFVLITTILSSFTCDKEHCIKCGYNNYCEECEEGYFKDTYECKKCHETCKNCKNNYLTRCTECFEGYYLKKSNNYDSYGQCKICSEDGLCTKCNQNSPYHCTDCASGSYLDTTSSPPKCKKCYSTCKTCSGTEENQCLTCLDGFYLTDDNRCEPCGENCKQCENQSICSTCNDHYFLDDTTYQCQKCDDSCESCHGTTMADCDECAEGYYKSNGNCRACDYECKTCKGSRNLCTSCEKGKYLDNQKHLCLDCDPSCETCEDSENCITCNENYYRKVSKGKCLSCDDGPNCNTCFYYSSRNTVYCSTCQLGYYPSSVSGVSGAYTCVKSTIEGCRNATTMFACAECMNGYFVNSYKTCTKCDSSCFSCDNATACTSCPDGYVMNESSLCEQCTPNCEVCESSTACAKCAEKYYLINGKCEKCDESCQICRDETNACVKCATGYYFNQFKRCVKCGDHCDKCSDSTHCLDCEHEYFVYKDGSCQQCAEVCSECTGPSPDECIECDPGYYLSPSLKQCFKCHEACALCNGPNDNECSKCSPGYFEYNKQCIKCETGCKNCTSTVDCVECNEGYYFSNKNCKPCELGCKNCSTGVDKCTSCFNGYYESSRDGDFVSCTVCPTDCEICSLSDNGDILCNTCFDGYYLKDKTCTKCTSPCETCTSEKECKTCIKGHLLGSDSSCNSLCSDSCATCENKADSCTSCHDGFILNGTKCLQCPEKCQYCEIEGSTSRCTKCLDGFFLNGLECVQCDSSCATCANQSSTACYTCAEGYYKYRQNNDNSGPCYLCNYSTSKCSKCFSDCSQYSSCYTFTCTECENGYYVSNNKCQSCHSTCKKCDGPTDQNCVECNDDFFLSDGKCIGCDSSCVTCEGSPTTCTSCKPNQYLSDGKCIDCNETCSECIDSNTCTKCPDFHFLHDGKCLESCTELGNGWGGNYKGECERCNLENCKEYDDSCQCTLCNEGYFIVTDEITRIEVCVPCQLDNCKACNGIEPNDCIECAPGYEMNIDQLTNDKSCISICEIGYFVNESNECEKCQSPCKRCSGRDGSICNECEDGYFLDGATCGSLPANCELNRHCENENKGEEAVQVVVEITKFNSYKNEKGGGAIRLVNCGLSCEKANFSNCESTKGGGGGIFIFNEKETDYSINLKGVTFSGCKAAFGGAVYAYSIAEKSPVIIESCNFIKNQVTQIQTDDKLWGGSALYLIVKNGSVKSCYFNAANASVVSLIKTNKDFSIHPEGLKMLAQEESNPIESIEFQDCRIQIEENPSMTYVIERQTSKDDAKDFIENPMARANLQSNEFSDELKREFNSRFISFDTDEKLLIKNEEKANADSLKLSSKVLMGISCLGMIVLIATIINFKRNNSNNDEEYDIEQNPIESLNA